MARPVVPPLLPLHSRLHALDLLLQAPGTGGEAARGGQGGVGACFHAISPLAQACCCCFLLPLLLLLQPPSPSLRHQKVGESRRRAGGQAGRRAGGQAGRRAGGQAGRWAEHYHSPASSSCWTACPCGTPSTCPRGSARSPCPRLPRCRRCRCLRRGKWGGRAGGQGERRWEPGLCGCSAAQLMHFSQPSARPPTRHQPPTAPCTPPPTSTHPPTRRTVVALGPRRRVSCVLPQEELERGQHDAAAAVLSRRGNHVDGAGVAPDAAPPHLCEHRQALLGGALVLVLDHAAGAMGEGGRGWGQESRGMIVSA